MPQKEIIHELRGSFSSDTDRNGIKVNRKLQIKIVNVEKSVKWMVSYLTTYLERKTDRIERWER